MRSNPRFFALFLALSMMIAGSQTVFAAWPFGNKEKSGSKSSSALNPSEQNQAPVSVTRIYKAGVDGELEDDEESPLANIPNIPSVPEVPESPNIPAGIVTAQKVNRITDITSSIPPQTGSNEPEALKIQRQIQDIIQLNDTLKSQYSDQAVQIQKISEQAKIHKKILTDLDKTKGELTQKSPSIPDTVLAQEKVNLIRKETEKSQNFLSQLQQGRQAESQKAAT